MAKMKQADELDEVSGEVRAMLRSYHRIRMDMVADIDLRDAREQVRRKHHQLQGLNNTLDELEEPYRLRMQEIEENIHHEGLEVFTRSFEWAGVVVRFTKGGERVSWKGTLLNGLVEELIEEGNVAMAERLVEARNITPFLPKVKVED